MPFKSFLPCVTSCSHYIICVVGFPSCYILISLQFKRLLMFRHRGCFFLHCLAIFHHQNMISTISKQMFFLPEDKYFKIKFEGNKTKNKRPSRSHSHPECPENCASNFWIFFTWFELNNFQLCTGTLEIALPPPPPPPPPHTHTHTHILCPTLLRFSRKRAHLECSLMPVCFVLVLS